MKIRRGEGAHLLFRCPGCSTNELKVGIHEVDSRWQFNGSFDRPTFTPSIKVTMTFGDDRKMDVCHSFVTDGRIQFLADCTHELAGKTVELPDWEEETAAGGCDGDSLLLS